MINFFDPFVDELTGLEISLEPADITNAVSTVKYFVFHFLDRSMNVHEVRYLRFVDELRFACPICTHIHDMRQSHDVRHLDSSMERFLFWKFEKIDAVKRLFEHAKESILDVEPFNWIFVGNTQLGSEVVVFVLNRVIDDFVKSKVWLVEEGGYHAVYFAEHDAVILYKLEYRNSERLDKTFPARSGKHFGLTPATKQ